MKHTYQLHIHVSCAAKCSHVSHVRMRKVLAILRSWYVCFRAEIGIATYSNLITTANVAKKALFYRLNCIKKI